MKLSQLYGSSRDRLVALSGTLDEQQLATTVPSTPLWTVADVYRHLLGVPTDVLTGNLEGRGTPEWTAAQVERSAALSVPEVCERWAAQSEQFETALDTVGGPLGLSCIDVWSHEQDVLGALGRAGDRTDAALPHLVDLAISIYSAGAITPAVPVRLVIESGEYTLGDGDPEITLRTTAYELLRVLLSRRSAAQLAAADWSGPAPERVFRSVTRFDLPVVDVVD